MLTLTRFPPRGSYRRCCRVGDLRLRLPVPVSGYSGTIDATQAATQCVQLTPPIREDMPAQMLADMLAEVGGLVGGSASPQSEDCACIRIHGRATACC